MANLQTSHHQGSKAPTKHAFTIIEVLIASAISLTVIGVISESFIGAWNVQRSQEAYGELQRASRFSLDEMSKQMWNATSVTSSIVINDVTYASGANTIVLRLPPLDNDHNIITGDDFLVFHLNGTKTERLVSPNGSSLRASLQSPLTLNNNTALLQFRYFNAAGAELIPGTNDLSPARTVTITVRSSRTVGSRSYVRELETTVLLRNKAI